MNAVGTEEFPQDLRRRTSLDTVCRVVVGDRGSRDKRRPCRVGGRVPVAVRLRQLNRGDGAPKVVRLELGLERADVTVCQSHIEQAEQPRALPRVETLVRGDRSGDSIPLEGRALDPEACDLRFLCGSLAWCRYAVAAETLHLVEVLGVLLAAQGVGGRCTELRAVSQHERRHVRPSRSECKREAGCESPLARSGALRVVEDQEWGIGSVVGSQLEDGRGSCPAELHAPGLPQVVRDRADGGRIIRFDTGNAGVDAGLRKRGRELTQERDEYCPSCRRDRCFWGCPWSSLGVERVRAGATVDGIQRIVDRYVGHRVHPRLVQRVVGGGDTCGQRRLAGVRVPDGDWIWVRLVCRGCGVQDKRRGDEAHGEAEQSRALRAHGSDLLPS